MDTRLSPSLARRAAFWLVIATVILVSAEATAYLSLRLVELAVPSFVYRRPPAPTLAEAWTYFRDRDPQLGWLPRTEADPDGSRQTQPFTFGSPPCVSMYGDSFAWGSEVDVADAPHNRLAARLHCRVTTFAVPGYGLDQAVLRHELNEGDDAPVAMLVIWPHDVVRSLTSNFRFLIPDGPAYEGLKPRFVLSDGRLALRPLPTGAEFERFLRSPEDFPDGDPYRPDHALGPVTLRFPYLATLARLATSARLWRAVEQRVQGKRPAYDAFERGSPSLALATALVKRFVGNAAARGQKPVIAILPGPYDFQVFGATGEWPVEALGEALAESGIVLHYVGTAFRPDLESGRPVASFFAHLGHYSASGYDLMAAGLAAAISADRACVALNLDKARPKRRQACD
jgi:hypothetical protein